MKWSKLKKEIEDFFASSVRGRVELRSTRYHGSHDQEGRGYICLDKEEIISFCTLSAWNDQYKFVTELREITGATDYKNPNHQEEYYSAYKQADKILDLKGIYTQYEYYDSLISYLNMPFDEALDSSNFIIKILVILDRRLGKRRILKLKDFYSNNPILQRFFEFRCLAEGIKLNNIK